MLAELLHYREEYCPFRASIASSFNAVPGCAMLSWTSLIPRVTETKGLFDFAKALVVFTRLPYWHFNTQGCKEWILSQSCNHYGGHSASKTGTSEIPLIALSDTPRLTATWQRMPDWNKVKKKDIGLVESRKKLTAAQLGRSLNLLAGVLMREICLSTSKMFLTSRLEIQRKPNLAARILNAQKAEIQYDSQIVHCISQSGELHYTNPWYFQILSLHFLKGFVSLKSLKPQCFI